MTFRKKKDYVESNRQFIEDEIQQVTSEDLVTLVNDVPDLVEDPLMAQDMEEHITELSWWCGSCPEKLPSPHGRLIQLKAISVHSRNVRTSVCLPSGEPENNNFPISKLSPSSKSWCV